MSLFNLKFHGQGGDKNVANVTDSGSKDTTDNHTNDGVYINTLSLGQGADERSIMALGAALKAANPVGDSFGAAPPGSAAQAQATAPLSSSVKIAAGVAGAAVLGLLVVVIMRKRGKS